MPRTAAHCDSLQCGCLPRTAAHCDSLQCGGGSRASDFRECQHTTVNFSAVRRLIRVILDGRAFSVTSQLRSFPRAPRHRPATASTKSRCHDLTGGNCFPTAEKYFPPQTELYRCAPKTQPFYARPTPFCPQSAIVFSETATQVADMPNKRKERPCDSVPTDRRCRVCCNPWDRGPCRGPLPETIQPSLADPAAPRTPSRLPLGRLGEVASTRHC